MKKTSSIIHSLKSAYRRRLRRLPASFGIIFPWIVSLFLIFYPERSPIAFVIFLVSSWTLTVREEYLRIFKVALLFFLIWTLLRLVLGLITPEGPSFNPLRLGAFVFLGLHLFFIWTPLELARALNSLFRYILGGRLAAYLAIAVFTLLKVIPWILRDAQEIKKSLSRRAPDLPFTRRAALWSQALMRLTFERPGELTRALFQRQDSITYR